MARAQLGGRVVVHGPTAPASGYVGIITRADPDTPNVVHVTCFPVSSPTALCLNAIPFLGGNAAEVNGSEKPGPWWCAAAEPEQMSVELSVDAFVSALKPLVETAVAAQVEAISNGE